MSTPQEFKNEPDAGGIDFKIEEMVPPPPEASTARLRGAEPPPARDPLASPPAKLPLDPNVIRFPIMTISRAGAEITGYPGWQFTDEESKVLSEALAKLMIEVPAWANVALLAAGMLGGKALGYTAWRRAGQPGRRSPSPSNGTGPPEEDSGAGVSPGDIEFPPEE